jgi:hypothetical protein
MNSHPNASAAAGTGGLTTLILYLAETQGWHVDPLLASGIATVAAAVVLFIGRRGIKGALASIWTGSPKPPAP